MICPCVCGSEHNSYNSYNGPSIRRQHHQARPNHPENKTPIWKQFPHQSTTDRHPPQPDITIEMIFEIDLTSKMSFI